jgi:hypothetical protein
MTTKTTTDWKPLKQAEEVAKVEAELSLLNDELSLLKTGFEREFGDEIKNEAHWRRETQRAYAAMDARKDTIHGFLYELPDYKHCFTIREDVRAVIGDGSNKVLSRVVQGLERDFFDTDKELLRLAQEYNEAYAKLDALSNGFKKVKYMVADLEQTIDAKEKLLDTLCDGGKFKAFAKERKRIWEQVNERKEDAVIIEGARERLLAFLKEKKYVTDVEGT